MHALITAATDSTKQEAHHPPRQSRSIPGCRGALPQGRAFISEICAICGALCLLKCKYLLDALHQSPSRSDSGYWLSIRIPDSRNLEFRVSHPLQYAVHAPAVRISCPELDGRRPEKLVALSLYIFMLFGFSATLAVLCHEEG